MSEKLIRLRYLPYRSKDGVLETFIGKIGTYGNTTLDLFLRKAIFWSEHEGNEKDSEGNDEKISPRARGCRLLDSFMTDAITGDNLQLIVDGARNGIETQVLLAHPDSDFARFRAQALEQASAEKRLQEGLESILRAFGETAASEHVRDVLWELRKASADHNFEVRLYKRPPPSPMYFFNDIALVGRFGTEITSRDLRWEMVVGDPYVQNDSFDLLLDEFYAIWDWSKPRGLQEYSVFISHSEDDEHVALNLKSGLEARGVGIFMANPDISPGQEWVRRTQGELGNCDELILIVTESSKRSKWVQAECGAAWILGKTITPAVLGASLDGVLEFVGRRQSLDSRSAQRVEELVEAVSARAAAE